MGMIEYRKYRPRGAALETIDQATTILAEAAADGWSSLTLRQLYYQFVARGFIENTVPSYNRLKRIVTDGRYGGHIDWSAIEDAGRNSYHFPSRPTAQDVLAGIERSLRLNPWDDQEFYAEVWVEKQALEATIARPCGALRTPYMACKGYLSASEAWRASNRYAHYRSQGKRCVLLHLGDHDPSGIDMTRDNDDRLREFLGAGIEVRRIALNMDQIEEHSPPPNPAKQDDSRYKGYKAEFGEKSWELDALRQNTIGDIITAELRTLIDQEKWDATLEEETRRREPLAKLIEQWPTVEELVGRTDSPLYRLRQYDDLVDMQWSMHAPSEGRDGLETTPDALRSFVSNLEDEWASHANTMADLLEYAREEEQEER